MAEDISFENGKFLLTLKKKKFFKKEQIWNLFSC
jgi:hypothetical protein